MPILGFISGFLDPSRRKLDLLSAAGKRAFLSRGYASVALVRTRASYYREGQYQSFNEQEVPLDSGEKRPPAGTEYEERLKVMATDGDGKTFAVFSCAYTAETADILKRCLSDWNARRPSRP